MKIKSIYVGIGIVLILLLIFTIPKYFTGNVIASEVSISSDVEKIEVYHFHGTNQCYSCVTMGDYAEETLNTYFKEELKSGKIIFDHVNGQLQENSALVKKFGATGSSLWIGVTYEDESFTKEENINVWYKIQDKQDYMNYLKGVIEGKLKGE